MTTLNQIKLFTIAVSMVLFFSMCGKDEDPDTEKPVITVAEPGSNDTISIASDPEMHIEFTTTDNIALKSLTVVVNDSSNIEVFREEPNVSGLKVHSYHDHYMLSGIKKLFQYTVVITATDKSDNVSTKTIPVFVGP
jgi:hypothetical protein